MQISAGFVTLSICRLLAVVAPSLGFSRRLWRAGGGVRWLVALGWLFVLALAVLAWAGVDYPSRQWEEALLTFLILWGVSLFSLVGLSGAVLIVRRWAGLTSRSSRRPLVAPDLQR